METQLLVFGHKIDSIFGDRKHTIDCNEKDHKVVPLTVKLEDKD